jgi:hypothetical protein
MQGLRGLEQRHKTHKGNKMKKLILTLALCAGILTANAQPQLPCITTCTVPNVVGLTYDNAVALWHASGFIEPVISANFGGKLVVYQSIPAGSQACCNTAVLGVAIQ